MVLPKSKKITGSLGKAIIRDRFKGQRPRDDSYIHTTELNDSSRSKIQSITQEGDLEEFLSTAQLAGTEFTGQKLNIKIVTPAYRNPYLLTPAEEKETLEKHAQYEDRLTIPRRPKWDSTTTPEQLDRMERESFLEWRRGLAQLQEDETLLLTPFERNIEVWRQLWRVIERSQLVVQIVDARNPMLFRSTDLEKYVKEVDSTKENLLLVNKADMLTTKQRLQWADYFDSQGIKYIFFSAKLAKEQQEEEERKKQLEEGYAVSEMAQDGVGEEKEEGERTIQSENEQRDKEEDRSLEGKPDEDSTEDISEAQSSSDSDVEEEDEESYSDQDIEDKLPEQGENDEMEKDERTEIRTTENLFDLLMQKVVDIPKNDHELSSKLTIGLVGYPNVGKSSTINALLGEKRVSVSSTPGKTKHFQTINLTSNVVLCDCPGLVFPTFSTTKADQVCNGVLPIDQQREYTGPIGLITQRIPREILELMYGIKISVITEEEGGNGVPTAEGFLQAYAVSRGYFKSGQGNPDESRAARYVLKDYVNGKLLYCHPPPGIDSEIFSKETNRILFNRMQHKKAGPTSHVQQNAATYVPPAQTEANGMPQSSKTLAMDKNFFNSSFASPKIKGKYASPANANFSRVTLYPHQNSLRDDGNPMGRRERLASVTVNATSTPESGEKKHRKGKKHVKVRSGAGYNT